VHGWEIAVIRSSNRIYDEYLVLGAQAGDAAALLRLIQPWQPRLLRHAWRLSADPERAKDSVQEAWIEILRGLRGLDDPAAFPAWALRIVSRRVHRHGFDPLKDAAEEALDDLASGDAPERSAFDQIAVAEAMSKLAAPQRAALALFYLEDMSVAEIAVALDVPPGTVKTRLMHARSKLRAMLQGNDDGQVR
jgi:RNA polymerase sigma factor (sigma-70 family)